MLRPQVILPTVVGTLIAGFAYYLAATASAGLELSVGYASLVWPATAVALFFAVRQKTWGGLGCAIGAFAAILASESDRIPRVPLSSEFAVAAIIAFAVLIQALMGAFLMRRFALSMQDDTPVLRSLGLSIAIATPVSLVRAVGETAALFGFGLVSDFSPLSFGFTIWIGDALAVLAIYPILILMGDSRWRRFKGDRDFRAMFSVMSILVLAGWLVCEVLFVADSEERKHAFEQQSRDLIAAIHDKPLDDALFLKTLKRLIDATPDLSRPEFADIATMVLLARPHFDAVTLVRKVEPADRSSFEQSLSQQANRPVHISTVSDGNELVPEPPRDGDYYPLDYVAPNAVAADLEGFDLASDAARRNVLLRAARSGQPSASGPLHAVGFKQKAKPIILVMLPFYEHPEEVSEDSIRGFIALRSRMDQWIDGLLQKAGNLMQKATISIDDMTEARITPLLYVNAGGAATSLTQASATGYFKQDEFDMEGRRWRISVGLPRNTVASLGDLGSSMRQILPQLIAFLLAGALSIATRQRRARDRFEAQVGALGRRYLESIYRAPRAQTKPVFLVRQNHWEPVDETIAPRCEAIWTQGLIRQFYQPIVDLKSGHILGFESLLRLPETPEAASLSTFDFVTWAERYGHIKDVTRHAIQQALEQIEKFQSIAGGKEVPWISINVSASDLGEDEFVDSVVALSRLSPGAHKYLKLEITESVLLVDIERTAERLQLLRSTGLRIALDDFGTGYASLSYLRQLPIDTLKIDRSFITPVGTDNAAREIVRSLVSLAHKLSLDVVAEGVEDISTATSVFRLGCMQGQGYLFAKASPAEVVAEWVKTRKRFAIS